MKSALLTAATGITLLLSTGQDPVRPRPPTDAADDPAPMQWSMRQKLEHSQALLDGLVSANFDKITDHSQRLSLLSLDDNWRTVQTEEYLQRTTEFQQTIQQMNKAGREKNLEAAELHYIAMIGQCFQCHDYIRGPSDR